MTSSPETITLVFGEPVSAGIGAVTVQGEGVDPFTLQPPELTKNNRVLTSMIPQALIPGIYQVRWIVGGADGDLVTGTFRFGIGDTITLTSTADLPTQTSWIPTLGIAILRWILFSGLAIALGGLAGEQIARRRITIATQAWATQGCLLVAAAASALATILMLRTGVSALNSVAGVVLLTEIVAAGFAAVMATTRLRPWIWVPLLIIAGSETLRAHPGEAIGSAGLLISFVHICAAALWVGALVFTVRAGWAVRFAPVTLARLFTCYAWLAMAAIVAVVTTGVISALMLVDVSEMFTTSYGRVLLLKLAAVTAAIALAFLARRRLARTPTTRVLSHARSEALTLIGVLGLSAVLVSLSPPALGQSGLPFAPPPLGTVVPVATRAGQIGVATRASAGQLVVQLSAPGQSQQLGHGAENPITDFSLNGSVASNSEKPRLVQFQVCGPGCFVAAAHWQQGVSRLTLDVAADGWRGGTVALLVPWPGRTDANALTKVIRAMAATRSLKLFETVTSDTSRDAPHPVDGLQMSGQYFIDTEPYSGGAPIVTVINGRKDVTRLLLGFPADNYTVDLTVDAHSRIISETLASGEHLITRTFTYPEAPRQNNTHAQART